MFDLGGFQNFWFQKYAAEFWASSFERKKMNASMIAPGESNFRAHIFSPLSERDHVCVFEREREIVCVSAYV